MSENLQEVVIKIEEMEFYDNDFEIAIKEACEKYNIEDLCKEGQRRWKAVMQYVGKHIFPDNRVLKDKNTVYLDNNKIPTNNNRYNYNILYILCDYYINLSNIYNKLISTVAFSYFVNIPTNTVDLWKETEPNTLTFKIWKKLQENREDSLKDKAADNGNVMGVFQVGRREFNWDMPNVRDDRTNRPALTAKDLPVFNGDSDYNNALRGI